jgi:hypothetical protein
MKAISQVAVLRRQTASEREDAGGRRLGREKGLRPWLDVDGPGVFAIGGQAVDEDDAAGIISSQGTEMHILDDGVCRAAE